MAAFWVGIFRTFPTWKLKTDHTKSPIITLPTNISTGSAANPKPTAGAQEIQVLQLPTRHRVYIHTCLHACHAHSHIPPYISTTTSLWPTSGNRKNSHCTFRASTRKDQIVCTWCYVHRSSMVASLTGPLHFGTRCYVVQFIHFSPMSFVFCCLAGFSGQVGRQAGCPIMEY